MNRDIVVLGAGISGISAGYFLGEEAVVYEKNDFCGGLCNSFSVNEFIFDTAVHLSFTKIQEVREIFDQVKYYTHEPNPINYYKGYWLKHPVQNNLFCLPIEEKILALKDFINKTIDNNSYSHYKEWLYKKFGKYIADNFSSEYTKKYWCENPDKLGTSWVENRMYEPSLEEVLYGAMTDKTPNTYYAKEMRYPQKGGYKTFLYPMMNKANIMLNKQAMLIDGKNKYVEFLDGSKVYYEHLISSVPLPELVKIIKDVPQIVKEAGEKLIATSIILVSVGFNIPHKIQNLWFYIYDDDLLPARIYCPNIKSKNNVPEGCSSLQFEIYYSKYKPLNMNESSILEHVSNIIEKLNIAKIKNILFMDLKKIKFANVVFYNDIHKNREIIQSYLDDVGIKYIGRFGEWDYLWSDQSLISGKKAATSLY